MKRSLFIAAVLSLVAVTAHAAGTVTWTSSAQTYSNGKYVWTKTGYAVSDGTGAATGATEMHGFVERVVTVPDGGGTTPTSYGCTLKDADGVDVLGGAVTGRSTSAAEHVYPLAPDGTVIFPRVEGTMTLSCTGMGSGKGATVRFYVQQ